MNLAHIRSLIALFLLGCCTAVAAQDLVLPGDANNTGLVNNIDIVYTGFAFGAVGPARVQEDASAEPQVVSEQWALSFPGQINYALADANGNGLVEWQDLVTVFQNYGSTFPPVIADPFPDTTMGVVADLQWKSNLISGTSVPGSQVSIPLFWEDFSEPTEVNGLAFSVAFDGDVIEDIFFEWAPSALNADSSWYSQQIRTNDGTARLEIAATRLGHDPIAGLNLLGYLNIIIEDDLIGLLLTPEDSIRTSVKVEKIFGVGREFAILPIGDDSLGLTIRHPDWREPPPGNGLYLYPNPTHDWAMIETGMEIEEVIVYDQLGRQLLRDSTVSGREYRLALSDQPPGWLLIAVRTAGGFSYCKLLVE